MAKALLIWALKFILGRLGADLDAEAKAKLAEYEAAKKRVEEKEEAAAIELGRIEQQFRELEEQRIQVAAEIEMTEAIIETQQKRLETLDEKRKANLDALRRRSDDDVLRSEI